MIGQTIAHYKVTEKLGSGGMGVVYKALDLKLERTVALKFLPPDVAVDPRDRERFLREARSASALDHPNIGVIHGLEETEDGRLFIVMGYYEGETLQQTLRRGGLSMREALKIAVQVASGLAAAHARKIVHRDIKPSNIIITTNGLAKIVDFGLARAAATPSMTQSVLIAGTPAYMSPEQTMGGVVDERSDVWALGVVMIEMLTGFHPFNRENTSAMTFAILNQPPAALDAAPPVLQPLLYRALSKTPEHRYPSGAEMLADLESIQAQLSGTTESPEASGATLTSKVPARDLKRFVEHASTPQWPSAPPPKSSWPVFTGIAVAALLAIGLVLFVARDRLSAAFASANAKHIAVLPFDNIGGDPANAPVAEGLMESMTSQLSNLDVGKQSLWVVPASVVRSRKITDPSLAAKELGANLIVKGSIQRTGSDIHLTVDLIDATTLRQIGSSALEDRTGDLGALQDEAVARLARLMNLKVTAEMLRATGGKVTPAAYESYLKALGYLQRYDKPGNLDLAISALDDSVHTDTRFSLGFAQLGEAYRLKYKLDPNPRWLEEASGDCQKAIQLDDRLPEAYDTLGHIHEDSGKHDLAAQEYQLALRINPRDGSALEGLAHSYENAGRKADAEQTFQKAAALRPDYWDGYNELGLFYDRQNRYAEAIVALDRATQLTPDNAQLYSNLGAVYLDSGNAQDRLKAETAFQKSIALGPTYSVYANLGYLYLQERRFAESAAMTEKALQINDKDYVVWGNLRLAYTWLKQDDKAVSARERELALAVQAAKMQPLDARVQGELGLMYAKKKLSDSALPHLQSALALAPDNPDVLSDVGEAYEDLGDRKMALHYIELSLQKGYALDALKNNPELQELLVDPNFHPRGK